MLVRRDKPAADEENARVMTQDTTIVAVKCILTTPPILTFVCLFQDSSMTRDGRTKAIFTTADDQMQGLWGFHRYVQAATDITEPNSLLHLLPQNTFQLTHEWGRYYDAKEMANQFINCASFSCAANRSSASCPSVKPRCYA
jgi:hypothetical protein